MWILRFKIGNTFKKVRLSWQQSNDRKSIDSSQFVTSVRQRLHITPRMLPLFFIDVPTRGHQSRLLFPAFFGFDKWIPPSSCFRASNLRFSSDCEHGGLWKCSILLFSLFLHCRRKRKNLCVIENENKRRGQSSQSWIDIHTFYKTECIHVENCPKVL